MPCVGLFPAVILVHVVLFNRLPRELFYIRLTIMISCQPPPRASAASVSAARADRFAAHFPCRPPIRQPGWVLDRAAACLRAGLVSVQSPAGQMLRHAWRDRPLRPTLQRSRPYRARPQRPRELSWPARHRPSGPWRDLVRHSAACLGRRMNGQRQPWCWSGTAAHWPRLRARWCSR
jgi:hypothetical protein